jgi:Rha family phage regulatory protein
MQTQIPAVPHLDLVGGRPVATSLNVAQVFGKKHHNVIQAIKNMDVPDDFARLNFKAGSYPDAQDQPRPMYHMTRDGFTLLAMGFTGKEAMRFKIAYIELFNRMEAELSGRESGGKNIMVSHSHFRSTQAPGGLDIRYTLDLTAIVRRPTRQSLEVLERLTGISLNDIEMGEGKSDPAADPTDFFAERCAEVPGVRVPFAEVYSAYKQWVAEKEGPGVFPASAIMFSRELLRAGFGREKLGGTVFVLGLGLQEQEVAQ